MFQRRRKRTVVQRSVEFFWPRMGWRRTWYYYSHRIKRLPGSPYSIACGFACGAAVSFTPFVGFHFLIAALLAWVLRGNILASAIGTAVGNPWTFPFIWAGVYWLGGRILGYEPGQELPRELTMEYIFQEPVTVLLPMAVGGAPAVVVVWFVFFIPLRRIIGNYQQHRRQQRARRRQAIAQEASLAGSAAAALREPGETDAMTFPPLPDVAPSLDIPDPDQPFGMDGGGARKARG